METSIRSLEVVGSILDGLDARTVGFYENVAALLNNYLKLKEPVSNSLPGGGSFGRFAFILYFFENLEASLKTAGSSDGRSLEGYKICQKYIDELLESAESSVFFEIPEGEQDEFLNREVLLVKLAIRESVFGFIAFSVEGGMGQDERKALETITKALSYKIKDFELNEVFKLQLRALQEAILEKEDAYSVIKKQHKKLQELDKTRNLFLANISHELRTPLNAIIGFSQALGAKIFGELNEKQAEYINDIQISSLHLLGMINEILDISKLEARAMKYSPVKINAETAIREVCKILEPLYHNKKIEVVMDFGYGGEIFADYQKFQQILYNLLSNAIKFTNTKGRIEIISERRGSDYILKIKDNGIGIDKKYHKKIFKKFVHLNNLSANLYTKNQSSTGLGLTITKELVKLHKGKIMLESEAGKGTTFIMEFSGMVV